MEKHYICANSANGIEPLVEISAVLTNDRMNELVGSLEVVSTEFDRGESGGDFLRKLGSTGLEVAWLHDLSPDAMYVGPRADEDEPEPSPAPVYGISLVTIQKDGVTVNASYPLGKRDLPEDDRFDQPA